MIYETGLRRPSSKEPVRKGPLGLWVLMTTPEDAAFVPTSASSRGGDPSEKKRLPVPNKTG
jgi:hypothetical protein